MYIVCVILYLFSALSRRVGALQISIILILMFIYYAPVPVLKQQQQQQQQQQKTTPKSTVQLHISHS